MKEILGGELDKAFEELGMNAKKAYETKGYQVWKISDEDFEKICSMKKEDWKDNWGWWRSVEGSNMGSVNARYNINHRYIQAWDGYSRVELIEESKTLQISDRYWNERKYNDLLEYFCDEIGASQPKNVCALAFDLAAQNNMTMAELFTKYQGQEKIKLRLQYKKKRKYR